MRDTCRVTRAGAGGPVLDHATGQEIAPAPIEVYGPGIGDLEGRCQFTKDRRQPVVVVQGAQPRSESAFRWSAPWHVDVEPGDVIECLSSEWDPTLPGSRFVVRDVEKATLLMKRTASVVLVKPAAELASS